MKTILFVCSGNTCRSPLAEGIAAAVFERNNPGGVRFSSAGTSALDGLPASANAVEVARRHSIDLSTHQSRLLNRALVRDADLIVTMGQKHRETVGVIDPDALAYTSQISEFCDDLNGDVPDPIGGDIDDYEQIYTVLEKCIGNMAIILDDFEGWKKTK